MIPGGPRNAKQMQLMMKRLGMSTESVDGVEEVIIRTKDKEHVIREAEVTILTVQGVKTYQVVGDVKIRPRSTSPAAPGESSPPPATPTGPPEVDVTLVMEQAGVDRAEALEALEATDGAPAEAILHLLSKRGTPTGG
jgi:nascent polypeptide-associated complex subunit alpha